MSQKRRLGATMRNGTAKRKQPVDANIGRIVEIQQALPAVEEAARQHHEMRKVRETLPAVKEAIRQHREMQNIRQTLPAARQSVSVAKATTAALAREITGSSIDIEFLKEALGYEPAAAISREAEVKAKKAPARVSPKEDRIRGSVPLCGAHLRMGNEEIMRRLKAYWIKVGDPPYGSGDEAFIQAIKRWKQKARRVGDS